ncbi:hypothetical protein DC094_16590 [Pelagibaculum spongiae]|uniref:Uncharacterized protein n=1 Tax=Pelagibaculum spongiae TaxID=2080658 RepID=A0A2V1GUG5_9GAMM|nr:hypothetical protein DC094_16590 [Pelagibaculum spongiae]
MGNSSGYFKKAGGYCAKKSAKKPLSQTLFILRILRKISIAVGNFSESGSFVIQRLSFYHYSFCCLD